MESGLKIAEVARRSGFAPSTLRYYEEIGLVVPVERTPAGYRLYDERTVERLAFVARAKQLGCSLEEIAALVGAWDGGSCAPVQTHLRELLETKIEDAQTQAAEMLALTAQLQRARQGLDHNTPDGPCDDTCGCTTDNAETVAVALKQRLSSSVAIACTLDGREMPNRIAEWQVVLTRVSYRSAVPGGVRLVFAPDVPLGEVARLTAAEHDCCRFFSFAITVDERGVALEVRAADDALPVVEALFGAAA